MSVLRSEHLQNEMRNYFRIQSNPEQREVLSSENWTQDRFNTLILFELPLRDYRNLKS